MDNKTIIMQERLRLLGDGVIGTTGRMTTIETDNGEIEVEEPEPIYTLQTWGKMGYSVIKGQHAVAAIEIWIPKTDSKDENKDDADVKTESIKKKDFVKKRAFFFKRDQVKEREVSEYAKN